MLVLLNNIEITNYFNCEPRFNGVFEKNNLRGIKDVADRKTAVSFDSFGKEYIPNEVLNNVRNESITHNIHRIQYN